MTVELLDYDAPSGLEMLINWLIPLGVEVGPNRPSGDDLPYRMVTVVGGSDDKVTDHGIYQVDDFASTVGDAEAQSRLTRRRVLALGPPLAPQRRVAMSDGRLAYADSVTTSQKPIWVEYGDDKIHRFVSRYAIDLRMVAV